MTQVHMHNMKLLATVPAVYIPSNAAQRKPGTNKLVLKLMSAMYVTLCLVVK